MEEWIRSLKMKTILQFMDNLNRALQEDVQKEIQELNEWYSLQITYVFKVLPNRYIRFAPNHILTIIQNNWRRTKDMMEGVIYLKSDGLTVGRFDLLVQSHRDRISLLQVSNFQVSSRLSEPQTDCVMGKIFRIQNEIIKWDEPEYFNISGRVKYRDILDEEGGESEDEHADEPADEHKDGNDYDVQFDEDTPLKK